jgi:hypothetical protein
MASKINIENFDPFNKNKKGINSPRSIEACKRLVKFKLLGNFT